MFEITAYLVLWYVAIAVGIALWLAWQSDRIGRGTRGRPSLRRWAPVILVLPVLPYAVVEAQTLLVGPRALRLCRTALRSAGEQESVRFLRVLWFSPGYLRLYVVTEAPVGRNGGVRPMSGEVIVLSRLDSGHPLLDRDCLWSDAGNADNAGLPPYPVGGEYYR